MNGWPFARRLYRHLFALCPFFIEQFNVTEHDGVISSSAAFARGVLTRPDQPHLCYVHSPIRYAWDQQFEVSRASPHWGSDPRVCCFAGSCTARGCGTCVQLSGPI